MAHEELVELADQHFGSLNSPVPVLDPAPTLHRNGSAQPAGSKSFATVSSAPEGITEKEALASAKAVYTGGEEYLEKEDEEFIHLYIGFEGLGIHDPDIVSACAGLLPARRSLTLCSTPLRRCKYS